MDNPAVEYSQANQFMYPFGLAGGGIATLAALALMRRGKNISATTDLSRKGRDPNIDAMAGKKYPKKPGPVPPSTPAETVFTK